MAIIDAYFELFKNGREFEQILFLDNFYQNVSIEEETGEDLEKLLLSIVNYSVNIYVRRSAFKILCDLTLVYKIKNRFSIIGLFYSLLSGNESTLQTVALKYLPHFPETYDKNTEEKLKELSDNSDGEVASQAYLCLGLFSLLSSISKNNITELAIKLNTAKPYFRAALQSTENRVDAVFYILLIDWFESVFGNDAKLVKTKFYELENNLFRRSLYEFDEYNLELDFQIFRLTQLIKSSFETANISNEWLEIKSQVQALLNISLEIEKIHNTYSVNQGMVKKLKYNIFENIETNIYNVHLASESKRLNALKLVTQDLLLAHFIEHLLSLFPSCGERLTENLELLSLLSGNLGSDEGMQLYKQIVTKDISLEKTLSELLRKNGENQLPFRTGSIQGQEVLISLMSQIDQLLPDYPIKKRDVFFNVVEEVIRYTRATQVGYDKKNFLFLFTETEGGKGQKSLEQDLQDSMYTYFQHSKIADGLDHEKAKFVDGGRVDILYKKDIITIPIELKRASNRPDKDTLEQNYIAQAQTYASGYDQLGIFVLMELSNKSKEPSPNFKDWFKVHHLIPSTNQKIDYPDYVISVVIPGNRSTPSSKSTYK